MFSSEAQLALLILALYGSTCVVFLCANERILERVLGGRRLRVADDRVRIAGRSLVWLHPFTPMFPVFRGCWGCVDAIAAAPGLPARVYEVSAASALLAPYVLAEFLFIVIATPVTLLAVGAIAAVPIVVLAYIATVALLVRLWFLREAFALSGIRYAAVAFECMACLPLSAGVVRRLTLTVPITEDLASFVVGMDDNWRARAVGELERRCAEMADFYPDESTEDTQLQQYRLHLATLAPQAADPVASDDVVARRDEGAPNPVNGTGYSTTSGTDAQT